MARAPSTVEQMQLPAEYGAPSRLLEWTAIEARLRDAAHYWIATVRADGRPHTVPVDGLWIDATLWFGGSTGAVKHRNLMTNTQAAVHLPDAERPVVVEGACQWRTPSDAEAADLTRASTDKYGYSPPMEVYQAGVWQLRPERILAWTNLTADATRFSWSVGS